MVDLNYNFECDWLSDNNLTSELMENRSLFKPITTEEIVIFMTDLERPCLTAIPNTEKTAEYKTRLMNFEEFGNVVKHCLECLLYLLNRNYN